MTLGSLWSGHRCDTILVDVISNFQLISSIASLNFRLNDLNDYLVFVSLKYRLFTIGHSFFRPLFLTIVSSIVPSPTSIPSTKKKHCAQNSCQTFRMNSLFQSINFPLGIYLISNKSKSVLIQRSKYGSIWWAFSCNAIWL